jgi:hypothetical protein
LTAFIHNSIFCAILVLVTGCESQSTHQPVAITVGVEPPSHSDSIKVATINLWGVSFSGIDISYKINDRFKVFTEYLGTNTEEIDIVLIQEAWKNSARKIILEDPAVARQFPFRVDANEEPGGSGLVILSAFPIENASFHRFQAKGNCFKFWEGDCLSGKGIMAAKLRVGQYSFWLANTHTIACYPERGENSRTCDNGDANGEYRQSQFLEIRNYFDCLVGNEPGLIGGDFNFTRTSIYYPLMENPIQTDCRAGVSTGWTAAEELFADPDGLDYIWTRDGDTLKWQALNPVQQIFDDPIKLPNGKYRPISDHPMLMAGFCLVHTNDDTDSCVPF